MESPAELLADDITELSCAVPTERRSAGLQSSQEDDSAECGRLARENEELRLAVSKLTQERDVAREQARELRSVLSDASKNVQKCSQQSWALRLEVKRLERDIEFQRVDAATEERALWERNKELEARLRCLEGASTTGESQLTPASMSEGEASDIEVNPPCLVHASNNVRGKCQDMQLADANTRSMNDGCDNGNHRLAQNSKATDPPRDHPPRDGNNRAEEKTICIGIEKRDLANSRSSRHSFHYSKTSKDVLNGRNNVCEGASPIAVPLPEESMKSKTVSFPPGA
eukprot:CAMPEP_0113556588 /NCGR_PEP_ID=MMETSP0015_2-20120614/17332_1 /TAXON_ID=2838 /ORGANISM="Odontella" /LENGTH=285 /DNA_ID=CAMNT_0000457945 /DNA_START=242 /DNA_END=1099 /DNA_ORIENTATION=- /assembly_acc=CAM_ASM_000160